MPGSLKRGTIRTSLLAGVAVVALLAMVDHARGQVGACCVGASCTGRTLSACNSAGGDWQGAGTNCSPNPCAIGRCCTNGACAITTQADCSGTWTLNGACTAGACPPATGACCTSGCATTTQAACAGAWSRGAACSPTPCGACCDLSQPGGGCHLTVLASCTGTNTFFEGAGSTCSPNPCVGACCDATTIACGITTSVLCVGQFQGRLSVCSPDPCIGVSGACCTYPAASCARVFSNNCPAPSAFLGNGSTCTPGLCATQAGACCPFAGQSTCQITTQVGCGGAATNFHGFGTTCSPNNCMGACCGMTVICVLQSAEDCSSFFGFYAGDGTACTPDPCAPHVGGCCFGNAAQPQCQLYTGELCASISAAFTGLGTVCSPNSCCSATLCVGACCGGGVNCTIRSQQLCSTSFGFFAGFGTTCSPSLCAPHVGACCFGNPAQCELYTPDLCASLSSPSASVGLGTTCSPSACVGVCIGDHLGACCGAGVSCVVLPEQTCASAFGFFAGCTTTCSPDPCGPHIGACCFGSPVQCQRYSPARCATLSLPGTFGGLGTTCSIPPRCCPADFNGVGGVTVQDIFDFLVAYFANSPAADFNHSGTVSVQDVFDFLAAYFAGCA